MTTLDMARSDALGVQGDWLASRTMFVFIVAESALFALGFLLCFGLAYGGPWSLVTSDRFAPSPMSLVLSLLLMAGSTIALRVSDAASRRGEASRVRAAIAIAMLLGVAFLALHALEEHRHLDNALTMASMLEVAVLSVVVFHTAHLVLGLFMLACVSLLLARAAAHPVSTRHALHSAALYWYFVTAVWVCIVSCLYLPRYLPALS